MGPDKLFGEEQCHRLDELMTRWRTARAGQGMALSDLEQAELDSLVEAEVRAAGARAVALYLPRRGNRQ